MRKRFVHVDARALELADLIEQCFRRQHDAIADEARHGLMQDARRNEPQDRLATVDNERMARVVTALKADDARDAVSQEDRRSFPCLRRPIERR